MPCREGADAAWEELVVAAEEGVEIRGRRELLERVRHAHDEGVRDELDDRQGSPQTEKAARTTCGVFG